MTCSFRFPLCYLRHFSTTAGTKTTEANLIQFPCLFSTVACVCTALFNIYRPLHDLLCFRLHFQEAFVSFGSPKYAANNRNHCHCQVNFIPFPPTLILSRHFLVASSLVPLFAYFPHTHSRAESSKRSLLSSWVRSAKRTCSLVFWWDDLSS